MNCYTLLTIFSTQTIMLILAANLSIMSLLYIVWDFDPSVIPSWNMPRWYGIMWAAGFMLGWFILNKIFKAEKAPEKWMDKTFIYVFVGGILGARLGHCLFYEPEEYLSNPIEILFIWEGGLASHGGALGVIIAAMVLSRKVIKKNVLYILDRLVVPTALAGCLIRLGNLFNHEIVGDVTTASYGFKFLRNDIGAEQALSITGLGQGQVSEAYTKIASDPMYADVLAAVPIRHAAQLYEAICYLLIFGVLMWLYWRTNAGRLKGFLLGAFFILVFGARFLIEFIKENQDGLDQQMNANLLNIGQILSIPLVLCGLFFVFRKVKEFKLGKDIEEVKPDPA